MFGALSNAILSGKVGAPKAAGGLSNKGFNLLSGSWDSLHLKPRHQSNLQTYAYIEHYVANWNDLAAHVTSCLSTWLQSIW